MVTDTDQTSEVVDTSSTDTVSESTSTSTEMSADSTTESTDTTVETATPVVPAYTPNYKLKVYDEEKELDDPFLKSLIKDEESEKKVKEIAQKYLGFDTAKFRYDREKNEHQTFRQEALPIVEYYQQASQMLQKKDLESFIEFVGIDRQDIYKLAVKMAEEEQLPQEQRYQMMQQKQITREREQLANHNQVLQSQQQRQVSEFRNQELNWVMQRPDVNEVAQAFDAKNGPGSFRKLVSEKGLAHYAATQGREDLSAEQAVSEVVKLIGAFVRPTNMSSSQPGAPPTAQNQPPLIQQNGQPPIIPNATGRGTSPVKKQVRSIADIKKRRDELSSSS